LKACDGKKLEKFILQFVYGVGTSLLLLLLLLANPAKESTYI